MNNDLELASGDPVQLFITIDGDQGLFGPVFCVLPSKRKATLTVVEAELFYLATKLLAGW